MPTAPSENTRRNASRFWHPPWWKWGIVLLLLAACALLVVRRSAPRKVRVELLPFPAARPAWDGAYPYLIVSLPNAASTTAEFKSSILLEKPTVQHDSPVNEFRVDLHSGMFVLRQTDLFVPDITPLALTRAYRTWDANARAFGAGTNHPYDICPTGSRFPYTYTDLNLEDGSQIHFRRISKGTGYADAVFGHDETSSEFYGAKIAWNGDGWTLTFPDGRRVLFPDSYYAKSYAQGAAFEMWDSSGHRTQLKRDQPRNLVQLVSPSGRTIRFRYDEANRITEAADDAQNVRKYASDVSGHLQSVSDASHILYQFNYEPLLHLEGYDPFLMTAVLDGRGKTLLENIYRAGDGGRVSEQRLANGDIYRYSYIVSKTEVLETIVTDASGTKRFFFRHGVFTREE